MGRLIEFLKDPTGRKRYRRALIQEISDSLRNTVESLTQTSDSLDRTSTTFGGVEESLRRADQSLIKADVDLNGVTDIITR